MSGLFGQQTISVEFIIFFLQKYNEVKFAKVGKLYVNKTVLARV